MAEDSVLRRVFRHIGAEVALGWKKVHDEELHSMFLLFIKYCCIQIKGNGMG
jgi:hypothetical protein